MNTCKDCIFWEAHNTFGASRRGTCDATTFDFALDRMEVVATADDDSNLQANLVTGPHFGCTLFKPRNPSS